MELRHYAHIMQRGWWIVLGVPLAVLALSLISFGPDAERYRAILKFTVTQGDPTNAETMMPGFNTYNSWQSSQYIVDDLPAIITSERFAEAVAESIQLTTNKPIDPGLVQKAFTVEREHRIMSIIIDTPQPQQAIEIAQASLGVLESEGLTLWNRESPGDLAIGVLDLPTSADALSRWPQPVTRLLLRLMLGFVAGIGLAFLRHYLDRTIRDRGDLNMLDVPVLAAIPREKS